MTMEGGIAEKFARDDALRHVARFMPVPWLLRKCGAHQPHVSYHFYDMKGPLTLCTTRQILRAHATMDIWRGPNL